MVRFEKSKICILIAVVIMIILNGCDSDNEKVSNANTEMGLSAQQWIEDIDYLHQTLPLKHKNLYHSIKKEDFNKEIQDLKNDVPKLKDFEIKCRLAQIVASIGDAHTSLNLSYNNSSSYPIEIWWFGEDLRVIKTNKEHRDILGQKLTHINSIPIYEIMNKTDSLISHENNQWLKVLDVQYVVMTDVLKMLGITSGDINEFTFKDDSNSISTVKLNPELLTSENMVSVNDEMPVKPLRLQYDYNSLADYLYWYRYIPEDKTLYFQYNVCVDKDIAQKSGIKDFEKYPDFEVFSEGLLKAIADNNIKKFVIDLRENTGGNSILMSNLARKLADIEKIKGKVFVIIGRKTYSSGVFAAVDLINNTNAVFYGEPTGGNVNGYGDIKSLVLKNSKLQISYSTKYFRLSDNFEENFVPNIKVNQTFNDLQNGIDDVYEAIKNRKD